MAGASVILIVQCIQELVRREEAKDFHLPSTIVVAIAVLTKFCLFLYCYGKRSYGPECRVLYEDHRWVVHLHRNTQNQLTVGQ